jgi:Spy/CpxP family protein refolding chaperone
MNKPLLALSGVALTLALGLGAGYAAATRAAQASPLAFEEDLIQGLDLSPAQQTLWRDIETARKANLRLVQNRMAEVRGLLEEELAFETPNLARVTARSEVVIDEIVAEIRANRDRRLALYDTLEPSQKGQVSRALATALQRWDRVRAALLTLLGAPSA